MGYGPADYYAEGQWNVRCSECGRKIKSSQAYKRWDNLWVCETCFEVRNPQDFVRGIKDDQSVPFSTSDSPWIYSGTQGTQVVTPANPTFTVNVDPAVATVTIDAGLVQSAIVSSLSLVIPSASATTFLLVTCNKPISAASALSDANPIGTLSVPADATQYFSRPNTGSAWQRAGVGF